MLRQEINLYPELAGPAAPKEWLSWKHFCLFNFICVFVFILVHIYSLWGIHRLEKHKSLLLSQSQTLKNTFSQLKEQFPESFFSKDLNKSLQGLEHELSLQESLLSSLKNKSPFSQVLIALSRISVTHVWLTRIDVLKSGDEHQFTGKALEMQALRQFLSHLSHEKPFTDLSLNINNIENTTKLDHTNGQENWDFEISMVKK